MRTDARENLVEDSRLSSRELSILVHLVCDTCPQRMLVFACCIVYPMFLGGHGLMGQQGETIVVVGVR